MLCLRIILWGTIGDLTNPNVVSYDVKNEITFNIWPQGDERPVPADVPGPVSDIFKRASRLLGVDDVASAAFSRTCLEKLFDEQKVPKAKLNVRIKKFLETTSIPSDLRNNVDLIREMGNFIHLNESIATGDVVEISPEEAGFALDILSALFEDLYVRQRAQENLRSGFVGKIKEIGKRTIGPPPGEEENSAS